MITITTREEILSKIKEVQSWYGSLRGSINRAEATELKPLYDACGKLGHQMKDYMSVGDGGYCIHCGFFDPSWE